MPLFNCIEQKYCLSVEAIAQAMDGTADGVANAIHTGLYRYRQGKSQHWQHHPDPDDARRKWVVADSLPRAVAGLVTKRYGNVADAYHAELLGDEARQRATPEDLAHWLGRKVKKGEAPFTLEEAQQLAEACGWLRTLASGHGLDRFRGKAHYYEQAAKVLAARGLCGLKVKNARYLQRKVEQWQREGYDALVNGRFGNTNGQKLTSEGELRLMNLYASPLKPTYEDVARIYNQEAPQRGWPTLTTERVRQVLVRCKQVTFLSRHGKEAFRKEFERSFKRRKPSFADALWSLDGFTIQLVYQNEQGQPCSGLYGYAVLDVYSDCILGYKLMVGSGEPSTLVQAAMRDATRKTGMRPYQLQYDNSSGNKSKEAQELFKRLAHLHFPTSPYNGKAKPIENLIARLEGANMRHLPNFKGGNITSPSIEKKANPDLLRSLYKEGKLPDREGAKRQVEMLIQVHNNTKGKDGRTPAERYADQHEKRVALDYLTMVTAFWVERKKTARYSKDGLTIEVGKVKHTYEVQSKPGIEDLEFRLRRLNDSFTVMYDPEDLGEICLYKDGAWMATAARKHEFAMARVDIVEGEDSILKENLRRRKDYIERSRNEMEAINEAVEQLGFEEYSYMYQHKEACNRMEGEMLDEILAATGRPIERTPNNRRQRAVLIPVDGADGSIVE